MQSDLDVCDGCGEHRTSVLLSADKLCQPCRERKSSLSVEEKLGPDWRPLSVRDAERRARLLSELVVYETQQELAELNDRQAQMVRDLESRVAELEAALSIAARVAWEGERMPPSWGSEQINRFNLKEADRA